MGNKALQKHLLVADTSSIVIIILTIEGYMATDNEGRPPCRATSGMAEAEKSMAKVRSVLDKESDLLVAQAEVLVTVMSGLEDIERASEVPGTVVVQQPLA